MPYIKTRDGTDLYVKDWGSGRPVILLHGWPLDADSWDTQAMALAEAGFRSCFLTTFAGLDAARRLYKGAGFVLAGETGPRAVARWSPNSASRSTAMPACVGSALKMPPTRRRGRRKERAGAYAGWRYR